MDEALLRTLTPEVISILVRRGADFAAAEDAVQDALVEAVRAWPDEPPARPQGLAGHRGLAQVPRRLAAPIPPDGTARPASRASPCRPGEAVDDTLQLYFLCAQPSLTPGFGRCPHATGRWRPDHAPDRAGLPGAGGDDGPADQPGQAHRLGGPVQPAR